MARIQNSNQLIVQSKLALKVAEQTEEFFKNVNKSATEYQKSEGLAMKQYELLITILLYLNPEFQQKSGESQLIWPEMSTLNRIVSF